MDSTAATTRLPLPMDSIAEICRRFGVERLEVFGSVLRDDFRPDSDVDFLVTFREGCQACSNSRILRTNSNRSLVATWT